MSACRRNFHSAFGCTLSFDFGKIRDIGPVRFGKQGVGGGGIHGEQFAAQCGYRFRQRCHRINFKLGGCHDRFGNIFGGNDQLAEFLVFAGHQSDGQNAADRTDAAVQSQFAEDHCILQQDRIDRSRRGGKTQRDRQIECRPLFFQVGRSKIDQCGTGGMFIAAGV